MYSEERSEKSTGTTALVPPRPCRMRTVVRVRRFSISWTSRSGSMSSSKQAFSKTKRARERPSAASGVPGREQVSTVGGHRQIGVMGAFPHEREQRQHAGPGAEARGETAAPSAGTFEPLQQAVQPVALVVEGVVAGQQLARLREQDHHEPHRHPAGGAVDVLRGHVRHVRGGVVVEPDLDRRDVVIERGSSVGMVLVVAAQRGLGRRASVFERGPSVDMVLVVAGRGLGRRALVFERDPSVGTVLVTTERGLGRRDPAQSSRYADTRDTPRHPPPPGRGRGRTAPHRARG